MRMNLEKSVAEQQGLASHSGLLGEPSWLPCLTFLSTCLTFLAGEDARFGFGSLHHFLETTLHNTTL